jgi:predicted amidohydrolase YtcJ
LPGFIDSHLHIDELGMYLNSLDLRGTKSIGGLQEKLQDFASNVTTPWILGHGWDQELFSEKRWPTKDDLDTVENKKPVVFSRVCLHAAVLNSKALEVTGISSPTGIVVEGDFQRARNAFKQSLSHEDCRKMLKDALIYASSLGLTCLGFVSCDRKMLSTLISMWYEKEITTRVRVYLEPGKRCQTRERMYEDIELLDAIKKLGIKRGFGDDVFKIQGIKILADGSLGARTAWLTKPYADQPDQQGFPNIGKEELAKLAKLADARRFAAGHSRNWRRHYRHDI